MADTPAAVEFSGDFTAQAFNTGFISYINWKGETLSFETATKAEFTRTFDDGGYTAEVLNRYADNGYNQASAEPVEHGGIISSCAALRLQKLQGNHLGCEMLSESHNLNTLVFNAVKQDNPISISITAGFSGETDRAYSLAFRNATLDLDGMPDSIAKQIALLYLHSSSLAGYPDMASAIRQAVKRMPNLHELYIDTAALAELPAEILEMEHLEHLTVRNTQLDHIPKLVDSIPRLKTLSLGHNSITRCDANLKTLISNGGSAYLQGNSLPGLPEAWLSTSETVLSPHPPHRECRRGVMLHLSGSAVRKTYAGMLHLSAPEFSSASNKQLSQLAITEDPRDQHRARSSIGFAGRG